ncbi:hypothetical protein B0H14DRAFT_3683775 [Mycena olivaceomarginata]|nr:hypothetical protein B0H14DRAFT_3683775 [Mycena olivaceomarginata]
MPSHANHAANTITRRRKNAPTPHFVRLPGVCERQPLPVVCVGTLVAISRIALLRNAEFLGKNLANDIIPASPTPLSLLDIDVPAPQPFLARFPSPHLGPGECITRTSRARQPHHFFTNSPIAPLIIKFLWPGRGVQSSILCYPTGHPPAPSQWLQISALYRVSRTLVVGTRAHGGGDRDHPYSPPEYVRTSPISTSTEFLGKNLANDIPACVSSLTPPPLSLLDADVPAPQPLPSRFPSPHLGTIPSAAALL